MENLIKMYIIGKNGRTFQKKKRINMKNSQIKLKIFIIKHMKNKNQKKNLKVQQLVIYYLVKIFVKNLKMMEHLIIKKLLKLRNI